MADQPAPKRPRPPSRAGKGPTPGSWRAGCPSPNPAGRPPSKAGQAFSERVRERVHPDLVIDLALAVAADERLSPSERLTALWPLIDRGFVKPVVQTEIAVSATAAAAELEQWDRVPIEERRRLLAEAERALSGARPEGATDDDTTRDEAPCHVRATPDPTPGG